MYSRRLHRTNWSERNSKLGALSLAIGRGFQLGYRTPKEIRSGAEKRAHFVRRVVLV
jgi:hypothetical protein